MRQRYKQNLIEAYLSLHSLRHKENSCGWAPNQSNRYQNFLIYLALFIAGDKGRKMSLCQFPTNLLPLTKLGDGAYCRNVDKALKHYRFKCSFSMVQLFSTVPLQSQSRIFPENNILGHSKKFYENICSRFRS